LSERRGHRGYIASRPVRGMAWPQHIQNLTIRDYCQRNRLTFLLSATEYAMPACYMTLEGVLEELPRLDGIVLFSVFMLPVRTDRRYAIYERVLSAGGDLHGALESLAVRGPDDIARLEDIFLVDRFAAAAVPDELRQPALRAAE